MIWMITRHGFCPAVECSPSTAAYFVDFLEGATGNALASEYFDIEQMFYPAWRRGLFPVEVPNFQTPPPASNDEFIGAVSTNRVPGLPPMLETDPERIRDIYILEGIRQLVLRPNNIASPRGIPDVDFLVRGKNSTPLYLFRSWRPNGPVPPENGPSFTNDRVVMLRRVGPDRDTPLYKTAYTAFPLLFLKEDQSMQLVDEMVDWFMLPFELTPP